MECHCSARLQRWTQMLHLLWLSSILFLTSTEAVPLTPTLKCEWAERWSPTPHPCLNWIPSFISLNKWRKDVCVRNRNCFSWRCGMWLSVFGWFCVSLWQAMLGVKACEITCWKAWIKIISGGQFVVDKARWLSNRMGLLCGYRVASGKLAAHFTTPC